MQLHCIFLVFFIFSCGNQPGKIASENIFYSIETDKARYNVGEPVEFLLKLNKSIGKSILRINYYFEGKLIESESVKPGTTNSILWTWQPPIVDYAGYLAEVTLSNDPTCRHQISIAIDVSSDWKTYPRYGFISKYPEMTADEINSIVKKLNRFHINGLQFYDWHNTHHNPLKGTVENPADTWSDIANRTIYRSTVEKYIDAAHSYNMNTMAYNLLYGAWGVGLSEDVKAEWGLYKDTLHQEPFYLNMPDSWADDIYFMNPANPDWKNYLFNNMNKILQVMDFDGWHIDQIGDLEPLYTYDGQTIILKDTFTQFINDAKKVLDTKLVMNAVAQYGLSEIASSPVEFLYNEVWNPDSTFNDLVNILEQNRSASGLYNTVLPAYMDYANSARPGLFNMAGILLTDAVIFANGGAHLELGDHMLCHEYFPNDNLKMTPELEKTMIPYYDFSVAYQTLLRNSKLIPHEIGVCSDKITIAPTAQKGTVWAISKSLNHKIIIHFINLSKVKTVNWRDTDGTQIEPDLIIDLPLKIGFHKTVQSIITMSPDFSGGVPVHLEFEQIGDSVTIILPQLKYWTTLLLECEQPCD